MSDIRNCVTWWEVVRLVSVLVQDSFCQWHSFLMPVQDDLICRSGGQNIAWGPFGGDLEDWVRHKYIKALMDFTKKCQVSVIATGSGVD